MKALTRRGFLQITTGLAGAALLAACGSTGTTTTPTTGMGAAASGSPMATQTRRASAVRYLLRGGSPDEIKPTQDFLDNNFMPQTGVKVTVEPTDANADEKLTAAMVGGNAQDVFDTWLDNVAPYAERGQVLDIDP